MDSQRFRQATGLNGCYHDENDARDVVDLTLKLGLGNHAGRSHRINLIDLFTTPVPMATPDLASLNLNAGSSSSANKGINFGPTIGAQEHFVLNHFGTIYTGYLSLNATGITCGGGNAAAEMDFGMMAGGDHSQGGQTFKSLAREMGNFSKSLNPCRPPPSVLNARAQSSNSSTDGQIRSSYGSRRRGSRRSRQICYFDPHRRCANFNCNTRNTPMWRNGPLGPKSLCNACGIKYKKEENRRRTGGTTMELAAYHNSYNSNPGNFPTPTMNGQTLLNMLARNADHGEIESSSGSRRRSSSRRCKGP
ncbi:hypothetical protein SADUNF_Sadunf03G0162000 [Salix dunnii]|uniref:GATA-type domain-containing protein n=1 Tax=Salix dunnii TaxID=1413687 RepID=A0A835N565_9ROSI|nr:hypothetical protein SADUNF_Sadunf03G0162000 [Salix dunnii]